MEKKRGVVQEEELAATCLCAPTIRLHPSATCALQYRTSSSQSATPGRNTAALRDHGNFPAGQREKLWREFFLDPSQWWDHRSEKTNERYPDFKHKKTQESLWLGDR